MYNCTFAINAILCCVVFGRLAVVVVTIRTENTEITCHWSCDELNFLLNAMNCIRLYSITLKFILIFIILFTQ